MGSSLNKMAALAVGAWLALPGAGSAQTIPSPFEYLERRQEAGVFGGSINAGTGRFGYAPSGGTMLGARYGLELSGPLGLEGVVSFIDSERDVIDPSRAEGSRQIGQVDQLLATIEARLRFSFAGRRMWKRLSPFLTFGGGAVFSAGGDDTLDQSLLPEDVFSFGSSFYGTLGLGSRWFVTDRIALRGDGVFSLWKVDTPPGFSDPTRAFEEVEDGEWLRGTTFSLTLLWRW
jgi:hypothetical protein